MLIKNKYVSLIFKILIVIIGIYGLYDSCFKTKYVGLGEHFSYYTNLSNLLCIVFFFIYAIKMLLNFKKDKHNYYPRIKGCITVAISITGIVYNFILRPFMTSVEGVMDLNSIGNYIVHIVIPLMVILDYILFDEKGIYTKKEPFIWLILPFLYFVFICIRAKLAKPFTYTNSNYPYFFLDIDAFGLPKIIINIVIAIISILILGYLYVFLDKLLNRKFVTKK